MDKRDCHKRLRTVELALCVLILSFAATSAAQSGNGYRIDDNKIIVDTAQLWAKWKGPRHVIDVRPDGEVQPHYFRRVYDVIAEDLATFSRPVAPPGIRKQDMAIGNLRSSVVYNEAGDLELGKKEKLSKFLDANYLRFPGNEVHLVQGEQLFTITDTSLSRDRKEVTLSLRSLDDNGTSTQKFKMKDKVQFPTYSYVQHIGISRAGSNPQMAANILDGDLTTYWEPDLQTNNDKWWVEVDLGRVIVIEKIVLHFVDQERGDPFRQFRILVAPEQKLIQSQSRVLSFAVVGRTKAPNTNQRRIEFSSTIDPDFSHGDEDTDWTGRLGQTVRILISESKLGRGRSISQQEWEDLPSGERGDILYYIRDQTGFEEPVDAEIYASLPPEQQGGKDYFIRERPRLSKIEVWGWGDNLSPNLLEGGGSIDFDGPEKPIAGFDADWTTSFRMPAWFSNNPTAAVMTVDLGALVRLDGMRIGTSRDIPGYIVEGADGSRDASGKLRWRRLSSPERETRTDGSYRLTADIYDPAVSVRFLNLRLPGVARTSGFFYSLSDIMLYTEGYVPEAPLVSDIIHLPGPRNLGAIHWNPGPDAAPEGTEVQIRTRTGDLLVEQIRYFDVNGIEKDKEGWEKLITSFKGPIDTSFALGGGWSNWSQKYLQPGDQVTSPGLRNFMQIQVNFSSESRFEAASIRNLDIELVPPVAYGLVGEIWPHETLPGKLDTFDVFLRPTFIESPASSSSPGFNEALLRIPKGLSLKLLDLSLGSEEDFATDRPRDVFERTDDGNFVNGAGQALEFLEGNDSLWVRLPETIGTLPAGEQTRIYNRIIPQDGEVVVGQGGDRLTEVAYGLLSEDQRGSILFFTKTMDKVNGRGEYEALAPEERGPIHYFRKQRGGGSQLPFDADGKNLDQAAYNALPRAERGFILGQGSLVRLRIATRVFLTGTTLQAFVRHVGTAGANDELLWQEVEAGNATNSSEGTDLTIRLPFTGKVLQDIKLGPNPFTPNGDGVNDELQISFSVLKVTRDKEIRVRIFGLDGRLIWEHQALGQGGPKAASWAGTDARGNKVPPGLYICQIYLDTDSDEAQGNTISRLVAVVY